jgi:hypothetical protein
MTSNSVRFSPLTLTADKYSEENTVDLTSPSDRRLATNVSINALILHSTVSTDPSSSFHIFLTLSRQVSPITGVAASVRPHATTVHKQKM